MNGPTSCTRVGGQGGRVEVRAHDTRADGAAVPVDHADKQGLTFPSQPTIARETGYGLTATKAATSVLHRRGFIRRADGLGPDDAVPHDRKAVRWVVEPTPAWVDRRLVRHAT